MAKKQKASVQYALKFGHPTTFRRTVAVGKADPYQLVFEPGTLYDLSEDEIACLQTEIASGLLVEASSDPKGRFRYNDKPVSKAAEDTIASLEAKIEELSAVVAKQSAELAATTKGGNDDKTSNTNGQ